MSGHYAPSVIKFSNEIRSLTRTNDRRSKDVKIKHIQFILIAALLALVLTACGGGGATEPAGITVKGLDTFRLDPSTLTGSVGEIMNVTLDNEGVLAHNFVITELNVSLGPVAGGQTTSGSFTPSVAG